MDYQIITTGEGLTDWLATLADGPLALDTEFVRTRTYYPLLGLFQIFDGHQLALVDPVAISDLSALWQQLHTPERVSVLHAASEDLELIHHQSGAMPAKVHDTQLALAFCGHGMSMGFNAMTQLLLGVELEKDQARTDWLARPLTPRQLDYAAADVHYLMPCYVKLLQQLEANGRLAWFEEECAALVARRQAQSRADEAYRDVGNAWQLGRRELAVLRTLCAWREGEAQRRNLALNFVVKEPHLYKCAQHMPTTMRELDQLGLLQPEIRNHGRTLLRLIDEAKQTDPESWPTRIQRLIEFPHYKHELKRIKARVDQAAADYSVPAELIASKKMIHQYLSWLWHCQEGRGDNTTTPRIASGWRHELLGELNEG